VRHFLTRFAAEEGKRVRSISGEALALLGRHRWPGNVRQLENTVFRAVVMAEGDGIGIDEFPQIAAQVAALSATPFAVSSARVPEAVTAPLMMDVPSMLDIGHGGTASQPYVPGALTLLDAHGDVRPLEEIESEAIRFAIAHYRGQMSEVARRLQIGRSTLYRKLEQLGLDERSGDERKQTAEAH
jgi:DNA-binding NtrC family response regulator